MDTSHLKTHFQLQLFLKNFSWYELKQGCAIFTHAHTMSVIHVHTHATYGISRYPSCRHQGIKQT